MKKTMIFVIAFLMTGLFVAIPAFASQSLIEQGDALLRAKPPEYEKAAQLFKRAGLQGDGEGYYRLGLMYEEGLLNVGNPCTDDLSALGKQKAEEYFDLTAENGYDMQSSEWQTITQDKAKEMMALDGGQIIVDVRRQDEYDSGHIPGAVLIPNESIGTNQPEELPDLDQIILIYCRSGNRSKQAAQKLADIGYRNVYEFGGIINWTGEVITTEDEMTASKEAGEMMITITAGEHSISAILYDNAAGRAFWDKLPLTLPMLNLYGREMCYRFGAGGLPDNDATDKGYEIGDISYWPPAGSLVILYKQNGEIFEQQPIGHTDDDLSFFDGMPDTDVTFARAEKNDLDFSMFTNVEITGIDMTSLTDEETEVLYQQARYCQAMTEADIDTMRELVAEETVFTHMSGKQQNREEYFTDVANGSLTYYTIGIENPVIEVNGDLASITYTSILNANAYGARGTYRISGTHPYEKRGGNWVLVNR